MGFLSREHSSLVSNASEWIIPNASIYAKTASKREIL